MDGVDLLQGKVAGLTILDNNYDAGTAPSIRIRGTGSITASSEPLWVVDGVISSANAFNPNDIEYIFTGFAFLGGNYNNTTRCL